MTATLTTCIIDGVTGTLDTSAVDTLTTEQVVAYRDHAIEAATWQRAAALYMARCYGKHAFTPTNDVRFGSGNRPEPYHFAQYRQKNTRWVFRCEDAGEGKWRIVPVGKFRRAVA